jgi:hypothetical protein
MLRLQAPLAETGSRASRGGVHVQFGCLTIALDALCFVAVIDRALER